MKRLELLIEALGMLAAEHPELHVVWNHLGDGPLRELAEAAATSALAGRMEFTFRGQLTNSAVLDFYRRNPVDVFANVSASEGVPVSIMEAQACGIPVVATAVGGTPEIVSDRIGRASCRERV